jgi:hypothetical protein
MKGVLVHVTNQAESKHMYSFVIKKNSKPDEWGLGFGLLHAEWLHILRAIT